MAGFLTVRNHNHGAATHGFQIRRRLQYRINQGRFSSGFQIVNYGNDLLAIKLLDGDLQLGVGAGLLVT